MLDIYPRHGVGPISLGMNRRDVAIAMRALTNDATHTLHRDIYANGKIVVEYDNEEVVSVCVNREPYSPDLEPKLFGFPPLSQQAHKTLMRMSCHDQYDMDDPDLGMSYVYQDLGVYFWRDTTPEALLREKQYERASGQEDKWYAQAVCDYQHFHVVGVFSPGYL